MHEKFRINWTKIKGGFQLGIKVAPHDSKSDLPLPWPSLPCTHSKKVETPISFRDAMPTPGYHLFAKKTSSKKKKK